MSNSKNSNEILMYGMTQEQIRSQYMNTFSAEAVGLEMVVAGILSDVQELNSWSNRYDCNERVRQQLNIAKFILFRIMDEKTAEPA